jgi:hypothetical protein
MNAPRRCRRWRAAGALLVLLSACASPPERPTLADGDYPGVLRVPTALPDDVLWQQRVTARWGDGQQRGFDAAVQKQGDVLTVLGLSPTGSVGFVIRLQNGSVTLQNQTDMEVPFPARFVVLDVQRVFFPWLPEAPPTDDGNREGVVDGEHVLERWRRGRLVERRFARLDGRPAGSITITYEWSDDRRRVSPVRALLDNAWFGYRLVIDTHAENLLPAPPGVGSVVPR